MTHIRTIKPDFFRHEDLFETEKKSGLPIRLAFAGLWIVADREGRFDWRPRSLKLDIFPFDDLDMASVLDVLVKHDFIVHYTVDGKEYGCIPSWQRHQQINARESPSRLPAPDTSCTVTHVHAHACTGNAQDCTCTHVQDNAAHVHACGEGNMEGNMEGNTIPTTLTRDRDGDDERDPLFRPIYDSMLKVSKSFSNYAAETKAVKRICRMIRNRSPTEPEEVAKHILELFAELRTAGARFWQEQPFTPCTLASPGIFDRLWNEFEKRREAGADDWMHGEVPA